jgi:hypothetical protein
MHALPIPASLKKIYGSTVATLMVQKTRMWLLAERARPRRVERPCAPSETRGAHRRRGCSRRENKKKPMPELPFQKAKYGSICQHGDRLKHVATHTNHGYIFYRGYDFVCAHLESSLIHLPTRLHCNHFLSIYVYIRLIHIIFFLASLSRVCVFLHPRCSGEPNDSGPPGLFGVRPTP